MPPDYLEKILNARVYDVAIESPLELAPNLSARSGSRILLKREDMQPVFSFKLRGAYNKMSHLTPAELKRGVIAASAGNHAQGVALAAQSASAARHHRHARDDPADQGAGGAEPWRQVGAGRGFV
jgi:threonine dehydratase